jgi:hypothetical protein
MRAKIAAIPDGVYQGTSQVDSDGVVDEPLTIRMKITKKGEDLTFDMTGSSPPCRGPMNSVIATTKSAIYLAIKHIFPEVPINRGTFEPLNVIEPEGTFLYAHYPRPVSGCAAEVSQRIAEAVFAALTPAIPDLLFAAPAGTSGNLGVGGYDPERKRSYIMYLFTGGGYGGFQGGDGLSNGCSTIGISKMPPVEVLEQFYPILFEEFSLREGSGGAGEFRGGFGINYAIRLRRGEARVSMVMDHGRTGPQGALGGEAGGANTVVVTRAARPTSRRISPRTRTSRSASATWCACRRRAAAASAIRASASPSRSRATSRAATTAWPSPREVRRPPMSSAPLPSRRGFDRGALACPCPAEVRGSRPSGTPCGSTERLHGRDAGHSGSSRHERRLGARHPVRAALLQPRERRRIPTSRRPRFYPFDVDTTQPRVVLQAALDARAQQLAGGKWASVGWRDDRRGGARAVLRRCRSGSQLRQLSLLKDRRFVSLAFIGANVDRPDADRFFKSLKLK